MLAAFMDAMGRRRRVGVIVLACLVAMVGIWGALAALRNRPAPTPVGSDVGGPPTTWIPPGVLTIWPESVTSPADQSVAEAQSAVDGGRMRWRLDPAQTIRTFARSILGWDVVRFGDGTRAMSGGTRMFTIGTQASCASGTSSCPHRPVDELEVSVAQPGTKGPTGIWSVVSARSPRLELPGGKLLRGLGPFPIGIRQASNEHAAAGISWYDGCEPGYGGAVDLKGDQIFQLDLHGGAGLAPSVGPDSQPCGEIRVAYLFAYTTPQLTTQVGDPLKESASISDLSIVPFRWNPSG